MALLGLLFLGACSEKKAEGPYFEEEVQAVKQAYAPDKRVALFNVDVAQEANGSYVLKGESNLPYAIAALKKRLTDEQVSFTDSIALLPAADLEGKTYGVVPISVANLRSAPKHSAELATQAIMGTPLRIYKQEDGWWLVQTPDQYLAWVDNGGVQPLTETEFDQWKRADKLIYTKTLGHVYPFPESNEEQPVSDMVAGGILKKLGEEKGFYAVEFPDGRTGYVAKNEAMPYTQWLQGLPHTETHLVATAMRLMGVPYLWGGTSTKGVDCSGFTKTVYFLNGTIIPRDASQQVHTGMPIDSTQNFENLQPGDLLFFGRKATDSTAEKVVHVGMWIGDNKFIHSSGKVRISSMDPNSELYDPFNRDRYLRSQRVLNQKDKALVDMTSTPVFKD